MTINIDEVKAALDAAIWQGLGDNRDRTAGCAVLDANAPTWLAQLCDEIERLRADNAELTLYRELDKDERDAGLAWRACADQLRNSGKRTDSVPGSHSSS